MERLQVDGKFFQSGGRRVFLKMVTYGPFPEPRPEALGSDLEEMRSIAAAGFNAVRIYGMPSAGLLDAAAECSLWVFAGLSWQWGCDFIAKPSLVSSGEIQLNRELGEMGSHPALAGIFVANEIPADLVRWMGIGNVREVIERLIDLGRAIKPDLLFAYSNFPTTEYLEPDNADFTAMNVYLELREEFASYLPRLHNIAGDRPVLISEVGFDSGTHGEQSQAEMLQWSVKEVLAHGMAGITVYSWSDWWVSRGKIVTDWSFGLMARSGNGKAALSLVAQELVQVQQPEDGLRDREWPMFSVIICTHNGARRMDECLRAVYRMDYPHYEVIVVDDGSSDHLVDIVKRYPRVKFIQIEHSGLSAARNKGAAEARGEFLAYTDDDCQPDRAWLFWLADAFQKHSWDLCGGPNLPPLPVDGSDVDEAVVASAPGAPSHVLVTDQQAEHIPGCNLVVRKSVFDEIGGFSEAYRVAGDDVDFCWRLGDAGYQMGFCGAAFVWHRRRTSLWRYFKQQIGYGKAEALLMRDHPERFVRGGGATWQGVVYAGGALSAEREDVIYHGFMGTAGYQQISVTVQPQRPLPVGFTSVESKLKLAFAQQFQPSVRRWVRWWYSREWRAELPKTKGEKEFVFIDTLERSIDYEARWWSDDANLTRLDVLQELCGNGWEAIEDDSDWDMIRDGHKMLVASELHNYGVVILIRIEMGEKSGGRLPSDLVILLEGMELCRSGGSENS